jgi:hypothetical protein
VNGEPPGADAPVGLAPDFADEGRSSGRTRGGRRQRAGGA